MQFKFRLQNVLDVRQQEFDEAARVVEEITSKKNALQKFLSEEVEVYYKEREEFNAMAKRAETQKLSHMERGLEMHKRRLLEIMQALRDIESDLELAQLSMRQANRNLKMMDNLKERKIVEFQAVQRKKDQKDMDEFNLNRFVRRSEGGS